MLIHDIELVHDEQFTDTGQTLSHSLLVPEEMEDLAYHDTFYSAPLAPLFDDNSLQSLPEVTDGFYADLSTVRVFLIGRPPPYLPVASALGSLRRAISTTPAL